VEGVLHGRWQVESLPARSQVDTLRGLGLVFVSCDGGPLLQRG